MASAARPSAPPLPAVQRYFEISLFFLVATGIYAIVSTGKLDPLSTFCARCALIYKGFRLWRGRGPELSARVATSLVLAYFLFFPADLWVFSRNLSAGAPNPALYAGLLSAIHLLLFATIVRLYSATTNRDYAFLGRSGGYVDAGLRHSYRGDGLSRGTGAISDPGGVHVRRAGDSPQLRRGGCAAVRAWLAAYAATESRARASLRCWWPSARS